MPRLPHSHPRGSPASSPTSSPTPPQQLRLIILSFIIRHIYIKPPSPSRALSPYSLWLPHSPSANRLPAQRAKEYHMYSLLKRVSVFIFCYPSNVWYQRRYTRNGWSESSPSTQFLQKLSHSHHPSPFIIAGMSSPSLDDIPSPLCSIDLTRHPESVMNCHVILSLCSPCLYLRLFPSTGSINIFLYSSLAQRAMSFRACKGSPWRFR